MGVVEIRAASYMVVPRPAIGSITISNITCLRATAYSAAMVLYMLMGRLTMLSTYSTLTIRPGTSPGAVTPGGNAVIANGTIL